MNHQNVTCSSQCLVGVGLCFLPRVPCQLRRLSLLPLGQAIDALPFAIISCNPTASAYFASRRTPNCALLHSLLKHVGTRAYLTSSVALSAQAKGSGEW